MAFRKEEDIQRDSTSDKIPSVANSALNLPDPKVAAHQLLNVSSGEEDIDDENELLNDLPPKTAILRVADNGNPTGEQHCADEARECERNSEHVDEAAVPDPTFLMPSLRCTRVKSPDLPDTVTKLTTEQGAMVYLVGTAHFSESSQQDVAKTIELVQPDIVMVELCQRRVNMLTLDEATILKEASEMTMAKAQITLKNQGFVQGLMQLLLLSMSAHLTKQLGMAPGGEFRVAYKETRKIPGCQLQLGDRPINITLRRALSSLTVWQKLTLAWYLMAFKDPISKEDVERCKQKDLLEEMLKQMTGEYPALSKVFVEERDVFLAYRLHKATTPVPHPMNSEVFIPPVVVGVVGIGHVPGIVKNWDDITNKNVQDLMSVPPGSRVGTSVKWIVRSVLVGFASWTVYKVYRLTSWLFSFTYRQVSSRLLAIEN